MRTASTHNYRKLSSKQELFAQAVAAGTSSVPAYMTAYKVSERQAKSNASRLLKHPSVMKRIGDLQAQHAKDNSVTIATITVMLRDAYNLSMETKQASSASQAAMGLAKLHGLIVDKSQVDTLVRKPAATPDAPDFMTEEDWIAQFGQGSFVSDTTIN